MTHAIIIGASVLALILQTLSVSLAWRIGNADRIYRFLAVGFAFMAMRRATALWISARLAEEHRSASWAEVADRITIPLAVSVVMAHFCLMQSRRLTAWIETHPERGASLSWPTSTASLPPPTEKDPTP